MIFRKNQKEKDFKGFISIKELTKVNFEIVVGGDQRDKI